MTKIVYVLINETIRRLIKVKMIFDPRSDVND